MLEILRDRRSIRRYQDREIDAEKIEQLKEAALRAPSSRGHQSLAICLHHR